MSNPSEQNPFSDEPAAPVAVDGTLLPFMPVEYPRQHWFIGAEAGAVKDATDDGTELYAVWLNTNDLGTVVLRFPCGSVSIELTSAQLRDVAARLAAMADYMDANPSKGEQP